MKSWKIGYALILAGCMVASCSESSLDDAIGPRLTSISPQPAKAGDTIMLTGTGFVSGMQICFGDGMSMCTPVTPVSFSSATATVPAGSGANLPVRFVLSDNTSIVQSNIVFSYSGSSEPNGGNSENGNNTNIGGNGGNGNNTNTGGNGGNGNNTNNGGQQQTQHVIISDSPRIDKMAPTGGLAGTDVTISGANLSGSKQVCFASECVNVTPTAEKIVVKAPQGKGNVQVRVDGSDWSLKAGQFSYIEKSTSTAPNVQVVEWCRLNSVQPSVQLGDVATSYAEVFKDGCTPDAVSRCPAMIGQIGYMEMNSANSSDPLAWTWVDARTNPMFSHDNSNQNDEYIGELTFNNDGSYLIAFRFSMDSMNWTYCDYSSSTDGFSMDQVGETVAAAKKPMTVEWCRIVNGNTAISSNVNEESETIYAQFFVSDDCTKNKSKCNELKAQIGYGKPRFSTPEELNNPDNYTWKDATFNDQYDGSGGQDHNEYMGTLTASAADTYSILFRGSVDGGKTWVYCDTSDNNSFSAGDAMKWEVKSTAQEQPKEKTVEWCIIQYPEAAEIRLGSSVEVYGRAYVGGCTDGGVQCKELKGQLGYGTDDNAEGFTYTDASYNPSPTVDVGNNNEFVATIKPPAAGQYRYGYRFSVDGKNWRYCDTTGDEAYKKAKLGTIKVNEDKDKIGWCRIQHPNTISGKANIETEAVYGQVLVENCTGKGSACKSVKAQVGYGTGNDPATFNYTDASYNISSGNNDEFMATMTVPTAGNYKVAYRFSVDNGATWEYCDFDNDTGFIPDRMATMTITDKQFEWEKDYTCGVIESHTNLTKSVNDDVDIYAQIYMSGCTENQKCGKITGAQMLYANVGSKEDISKWNAINANHNDSYNGNNDEYMIVSKFNEGEYQFAFAFDLKDGNKSERVYCYANWSKDPAYGTLKITK